MKALLTATLCFWFFICQGQEILPRIGFALNTGSFPDAVVDVDASFTTGFLTGIDFLVPVNDQFIITSELLFVQKGYLMEYKFDNDPLYDRLVEKTRVNYADFLCLPTYKWSNLYFMIGPGLSYGLSGNQYYALTDHNGGLSTRNSKIYFKDQAPGTPGDQYIAQRFALTGVAAVGMTLWERFLIDVRYQITPTQHPYPFMVDSDSHDWYLRSS